MATKKELILFEKFEIRRTEHKQELYYSVVDIIKALEVSERPSKYWSDLKKQLETEGFEVSVKIGKFKFLALDGKMRPTDCINTENAFRLIQSIPSPKVEPFKQWLAKIAKERIDEIENPSIAIQRGHELYKRKGYDENWIAKREKTIKVRNNLTAEWKFRGISQGFEYGMLTNKIYLETFGLKASDYKKVKGLNRKNSLRDNMTDMELVLNLLAETSTTEITQAKNANGFDECIDCAKEGGKIAGNARRQVEEQLGRSIISRQNFLPEKV